MGEIEFAALYRELFGPVHAYVRRRTDADTAEDVVAEVFVTVWRRRHDAPRPPELRPWVFVVARHTLANAQRRLTGQRRLARDLVAAVGRGVPVIEPDHGSLVADREVAVAALAALSRDDQDLVVMVAMDGLSVAECAAVLGVSTGAVAMRLNRARARLERAMAEQENGRLPEPRSVVGHLSAMTGGAR